MDELRKDELESDDVDEQDAELLPDREAMSIISPEPLAPGSAGIDPAPPPA